MLGVEQARALIERLTQGGLLYPAATPKSAEARIEVWAATLGDIRADEIEATKACIAWCSRPSQERPRLFGPGDLADSILNARRAAHEGRPSPRALNPAASDSERGKPFWASPEECERVEAVVRAHPWDGKLHPVLHARSIAIMAGLVTKDAALELRLPGSDG